MSVYLWETRFSNLKSYFYRSRMPRIILRVGLFSMNTTPRM